MKYAIFADVHSNLEAFEVILDYYYRQAVDRYIFLGDIIGYGGNPNDCLDRLKDLKPICVAGNHDWAVTGKFSINYFNIHAKEAILWTKHTLKKEDFIYLDKFELTIEENDFICVHGSLESPHEFNYILDLDDAVLNFQFLKKKLCFVGHSHRPGAYCLSGENVTYLGQERIELNPNKHYIVNVGSVGQPRDGDPRSCLCIYDDESQTVELIRIGYDISKAAASILNHGLPVTLATRLYDGR